MLMTTAEFDPNLLLESTVVGVDDENIGKVGQVYLDNDTGRPNWVTVRTGWFGINESFVPLEAATFDGDTIRVPFDKATIKDAPNYETDAPLGESDEQRLYSYYGSAARPTATVTRPPPGWTPMGTRQPARRGPTEANT